MKRLLVLIIPLIIITNSYSQIHVGLSTGYATPFVEYPIDFHPTYCINGVVNYFTSFNMMFGFHISSIKKMNFNGEYLNYSNRAPTIYNNTIHLSYQPILSFSVNYFNEFTQERSLFYCGLNCGMYNSSMIGEIRYDKYGIQDTLVYNDKYSSIGISPKIGTAFNITNNFKLNCEFKFDIVLNGLKESFSNLNIGFIYSLKQKKQ